MKLDYIHEFKFLAQNGNYLDSANQLFISQSTLTRHIQALEANLGVPLFSRSTHKIALNVYGQTFLPYAEQIDQALQSLQNELSAQAKTVRGRIRIGAIPMMSYYNITDLLVQFKKTMPEVTLEITETDSSILKELVRSGQCDFAFVREISETEPEFDSMPFATDSLVAVLCSNHPLAAQDSVSITDLRNENFLLLPEDTLMHQLCMDLCQKAGFTPHINFTDYNGQNIINLVGKGVGCSLLMKRPASVMAHLNSNTTVIDITPPAISQISLISARPGKMSTMGRYFWSFVQNQQSEKDS